jgi:hypothetical protein
MIAKDMGRVLMRKHRDCSPMSFAPNLHHLHDERSDLWFERGLNIHGKLRTGSRPFELQSKYREIAMSNPTGKGGFSKGRSGNPGGRPRQHIGDLSREARKYAALAIGVLVKVARSGQERNRLVASRELLDRGYGRPVQMFDAMLLGKKLNELTPDELAALEARMMTSAADDAATSQPDMFRTVQ